MLGIIYRHPKYGSGGNLFYFGAAAAVVYFWVLITNAQWAKLNAI